MTIQANLKTAYVKAFKARDRWAWECRRLARRMSPELQNKAELEALNQLTEEYRKEVAEALAASGEV